MQETWGVLVASANPENRRALIRILDGLAILALDTFTCSTLQEAEEMLARGSIQLTFCDEHLPYGSYRDLLGLRHNGRMARLVVTLQGSAWNTYQEAMRLGAFHAIRCPVIPTDVELAVLHAMREAERGAVERLVA